MTAGEADTEQGPGDDALQLRQYVIYFWEIHSKVSQGKPY